MDLRDLKLDWYGPETNFMNQRDLKLNWYHFPVIIRSAYALGGLGSGFAENINEFKEKITLHAT